MAAWWLSPDMTEQGSTDSESTDGADATSTSPTGEDEAPAEGRDGSEEAADGSAGEGAQAVGEDVDEELVERVDDADPESIARELAALRVEVDGLEARLAEKDEAIEDLESKLARSRADFQNYKKRAEKRREEERERAKADLVDQLLEVHDNLQRALDQDEDADIRGGVESTLQQFDDVLAAEDVTAIDPEPGTEVDPHRHEVLVRVESDRPEGAIDDVHRIGYEMGESIVREAQVTVSDGSSAGGDAGDDDSAGADADAT